MSRFLNESDCNSGGISMHSKMAMNIISLCVQISKGLDQWGQISEVRVYYTELLL